MPVSDDEDMVGRPRRGRPRLNDNRLETTLNPPTNGPLNRPSDLDISDVYRGVTITWLMNAFRLDRSTVKKKLADLQPVKFSGNNVPVYDFVQAASYLVKPRVDLNEYIRKLRPEELPTDLQKDFWDAKLKRQKFEEQAGELWRTSDVIEVFGEAFKHIKISTQLWVSALERTQGLTPDQYKTLEKLADQLLDDLHTRLTNMKDMGKTLSSKGEETVHVQ